MLLQNPYGRRSVWEADTNDELEEKWLQLQAEHEAYRYATQYREDEHVEDHPPRVWVGSLADYVAGYLHGDWLDATLDHEDLANAVLHVLRNSHEESAEEYGFFDYDGFGHGLDGYLVSTRALRLYPGSPKALPSMEKPLRPGWHT